MGKEFFNVTKNSENVVCHFYREETFRCKIMDKHLAILAKKHVETKFCKTDEFSTEMLAWRLGHAEVINYKGDLNTPPDQAERKKKTNFVGKKMRMGKGKGGGDESSDENDW